MNYFIIYICLGLYFSIGLILLIVKSPVSRAVDETMKEELFQYKTRELIYKEKIPYKRMRFFRFALWLVSLIIYPLTGYENIKKQRAAKLWHNKQKSHQRPWDSSPSPYTKKVSVLEAENNHMESIDNKQIPFASNDDEWQAMLSKMQDGDELWEYTSPDEMWEMLAGREGIVLVRDGIVIDELLLIMN